MNAATQFFNQCQPESSCFGDQVQTHVIHIALKVLWGTSRHSTNALHQWKEQITVTFLILPDLLCLLPTHSYFIDTLGRNAEAKIQEIYFEGNSP